MFIRILMTTVGIGLFCLQSHGAATEAPSWGEKSHTSVQNTNVSWGESDPLDNNTPTSIQSFEERARAYITPWGNEDFRHLSDGFPGMSPPHSSSRPIGF